MIDFWTMRSLIRPTHSWLAGRNDSLC